VFTIEFIPVSLSLTLRYPSTTINTMSFSALARVLTVAILGSMAFTSAVARQAMGQEGSFYPRPAYFPISGTCSVEMSPDRAVILGGVSSSALKPSDAVEQLDKQLALMRSYVAEKHGELQLMERVRTLKNPQPGREDPEPPFQLIQRLQASFPADAAVDSILQKLIELGFDRFGDNVLNNYNRRETVVRFRISNFDAKLNDLQQRCTADAWKQWCEPANAIRACPSQTPPPTLELQAFNVHSKEALMRPEGPSVPWQVSVNRMQRSPEPPDLLGDVTVHLEATISLSYHAPDEKP